MGDRTQRDTQLSRTGVAKGAEPLFGGTGTGVLQKTPCQTRPLVGSRHGYRPLVAPIAKARTVIVGASRQTRELVNQRVLCISDSFKLGYGAGMYQLSFYKYRAIYS